MKNPFDPREPGTAEERAEALEMLGITEHEGGFTLGVRTEGNEEARADGPDSSV